jgi:predicted amidohydrolase YtcJ
MKYALALLALLVACGIAVSILFFSPGSRNVTMLLVNGRFYTLDERHPVAEAVAIEGDRIAGVGTTASITSRFKADRVVDLGGKPVYPGFIDSHAHLEGLGEALRSVNLAGAASVNDAVARVAQAVKDSGAGRWITGRGWDQNIWPGKAFPTHEALDHVAPDVPVYLVRVDGHAAWANAEAMKRAGVTPSTPDPEGGRIVRDARGNPTGVFIDNAIPLVFNAIPEPGTADRRESVKRAVAACLSLGLTEVHDMGVDAAGIEVYRNMIRAGEFPFRVYVAVEGSNKESWAAWRDRGPEINGEEGKLNVRAVKMYADGALGSRGAALIDSYSDDPGNRGLTLTSKSELLEMTRQALGRGFQICIHAIGDRANAIVLDVYTVALKDRVGRSDDRCRIEHAQVIAPGDIPRFAALRVLPMMQPSHFTSDMPWAVERLGPERMKGAYAWRSLIAAGSIVPCGSDFPVEAPGPLLQFYAAVTRQRPDGTPPGGWMPGEAMTRDEALRGLTIWGAYAGFQEKEKGSIETGKWADLVVLSKDIMAVPPQEILSAQVEMTMVGGRVAYRNSGEAAPLP